LLQVGLCLVAACSSLAPASRENAASLAPSGTLRAAINLGNPILADRDPSGQPEGVSVDLAQALADRLGVPLRLVVYPSAGQVVAAGAAGAWDIAFVARDPERSASLIQTAPYLAIEGAYLVPTDSPIRSNDEVDRAGIRVVVGAGSAYDLYLSRTLQHAALVRTPSSPEVTATLLAQHLEVAAGVRQQLEADARRIAGVRLLPGRFMEIDQAMATLPSHAAGTATLEAFVADMKRSGFVARALAAHHIEGAIVTP
jgi:polar amino acid transport system substrate-binding protein